MVTFSLADKLPVHMTICVVATPQVSPPFGDVTVRTGAPIVKLTGLVPLTGAGPFVQLTRVRAFDVLTFGTVKLADLIVAVAFASAIGNEAPPSVLSDTLT